LLLYARHPPHLQMSPFGATLKASWCFLPISAACVHNGEVFGFRWIFFLLFSLFSLSSPCQNIKVSFNLFFVCILVLVLLISICFIFLYLFLINFLFNFTPHYLVSFSFNLYIKLSPRSFDWYLFIFNHFPTWYFFKATFDFKLFYIKFISHSFNSFNYYFLFFYCIFFSILYLSILIIWNFTSLIFRVCLLWG